MLKNFELANECLNKSVFSNYTQILVNTVSAVFVISGTIYITFEIKWWMALLALTVTAVNTVCNVLLSKTRLSASMRKRLSASSSNTADSGSPISAAQRGARVFASKIHRQQAARIQRQAIYSTSQLHEKAEKSASHN